MLCPGCGVPEGSAYFTGNTTWRCLAQSSGDALSDQLLTDNITCCHNDDCSLPTRSPTGRRMAAQDNTAERADQLFASRDGKNDCDGDDVCRGMESVRVPLIGLSPAQRTELNHTFHQVRPSQHKSRRLLTPIA
jgi:hypothetical protein